MNPTLKFLSVVLLIPTVMGCHQCNAEHRGWYRDHGKAIEASTSTEQVHSEVDNIWQSHDYDYISSIRYFSESKNNLWLSTGMRLYQMPLNDKNKRYPSHFWEAYKLLDSGEMINDLTADGETLFVLQHKQNVSSKLLLYSETKQKWKKINLPVSESMWGRVIARGQNAIIAQGRSIYFYQYERDHLSKILDLPVSKYDFGVSDWVISPDGILYLASYQDLWSFDLQAYMNPIESKNTQDSLAEGSGNLKTSDTKKNQSAKTKQSPRLIHRLKLADSIHDIALSLDDKNTPQQDPHLWISSISKLYRLPITQETQQPEPLLVNSQQTIQALAVDRDQKLWYATKNHGLIRYQGHSKEQWGYKQGLPDDELKSLFITRDNQLWVSPKEGRPRRAEIQAIARAVDNFTPQKPIKGSIYNRVEDALEKEMRSGQAGQVGRLEYKDQWRLYFQNKLVYPGADFNYRAGYKRPDDQALFAFTGKLGHWNGKAWLEPGWPNTGGDIAIFAFLDRQQRYWLYTFDHHVFLYSSNKWQEVYNSNPYWQTVIGEGPRGEVYLGTTESYAKALKVYQEDQLKSIDLRTQEQKSAETQRKNRDSLYQPPQITILDIQKMGEKGLAIASSVGLHWRFKDEDWDFIPLEQIPLKTMHDLMFQAKETEQGSDYLWVAGEPGLARLNLTQGESRHWSSRTGLFTDRIMSLAQDDQDRVWLISDTDQIGIYDLKTLK